MSEARSSRDGSQAPDGSVFWRIPITRPQSDSDTRAVELIEIDAQGYIPREVVLAKDGSPVEVIRPAEYGPWGDSGYVPHAPPGSAEFDAFWHPLGEEMSREDFEEAYERAAAVLPLQGDLARIPCLVGLAVLLVLAGLVCAAGLGWFDALNRGLGR